jgi:hypothetical protein
MERFLQVDDMVLRGAAPSENDIKILRGIWDVDRVISLDQEIGDSISKACEDNNIEHIILHLGDGNHENVPILARHIVPKLNDKKTFVHCRHGKDRTGMACALYRISQGWNLDKALKEASKMGMGLGLSPSTKKSYYDAVKKWSKKFSDVNKSDIVEVSRDNLLSNNLNPAHMHTANNGWADQLGNDYLNRPASDKIYRICNPRDLLQPKKYWFSEKKDAKGSGKLYSAVISSDAEFLKYFRNPNEGLIRASMLKGADIVSFANKFILVLNPYSLINIKKEDSDVNNIVEVGQHDNYTGEAQFSAPGSGGLMETNTGGFAGFVSLPGNGLDL